MCTICYDNSPFIFCLQACGHVFCQSCVEDHVNSSIFNNSLPICCPECDEKLTISDIKRAVNDKLIFEKLSRYAVKRIIQLNKDKYIECISDDCDQIF